jgi:hypothetical protein
VIDRELDNFLAAAGAGADPAIRNAVHTVKRSADRVARVVAR